VENPELRPLGAGEMLDRAITLYVRRFASIVAVLAIVSVPLIVMQALVAPQSARVFSDLGQMLSAAGSSAASHKAADALALDNRMSPLAFAVIFGASVFRVLMWCAVVAVVAAAYSGVRTTIGDAYRLALRRWVPQIIVSLAFLILGMLSFIPVFVLYLLLVLAVVAAAALNATIVAVVVGIIGGLVVIACAVAIGAMVFMTYELASVAVITETGNPVDAIGIAMRRAFAPGMKRRTLVGGIVLGVVSQAGALPLIGLAAVATAVTHVDALYFAILGVGGVLLDGILAAFAVVFAVDARIRREGYDLLAPETPAVSA
jgi:hypothetical protein